MTAPVPGRRFGWSLLTLALLLIGTGVPARAGAKPEQPPSIVIVGDVLLAGRVETAMSKKGLREPFRKVRPLLREADLTIGNLEYAISTRGKPAEKTFTFRALPKNTAALQDAGFDVMTLANNHSVDYGREALTDTVQTLRRHGLAVTGAGKNAAAARRWVTVRKGTPPVRIAVLAFSNMLPTSFYAGPNRPGTNPAYPDRIKADVAAARKRADIVIVLFHWGTEKSATPSASQRRLAYLAADAGADLVVGHHPHVLQGFEHRGHTLIAYSLGNFVFPSRGATRNTVILRYIPHRNGRATVEIIPCVIKGFQPAPAGKKARTEILSRLTQLSRKLGQAMPDAKGRISIGVRENTPRHRPLQGGQAIAGNS